MVTSPYKPASPAHAAGTSARLIRQSQAFRVPFNKQTGYISAAIFVGVYLLMTVLHGFSFGVPDRLGYQIWLGASSFWHQAYIGEGIGGARIDVLYNPGQFLLYLFAAVAKVPIAPVLIIQSIGLVSLLGYHFARFVADRARNWIFGLAGITAVLLFLNGDFTLSVTAGNQYGIAGLLVALAAINMAVSIRAGIPDRSLTFYAVMAILSHSLGLFIAFPLVLFYTSRIERSGNEKVLNFLLTYVFAAITLFVGFRLIYFGTLGFFDPIINFQWQVSVHGLTYIWGGITRAFFQLQDSNGLLLVLLLMMALLVERMPSLGYLGLLVVTLVVFQGLVAIVLPMPSGDVSHFTWLVPLLTLVPAYFAINPLPHFIPTWKTRLFIMTLGAVMFCSLSFNAKSEQVKLYPELADPLDQALKKLDVTHPVVYGFLPKASGYHYLRPLSYCRIHKELEGSPGVFLNWFFEVASPDAIILDLRTPLHSQIYHDARFEGSYQLLHKQNDQLLIYGRRDQLAKGEEYAIQKRLEEIIANGQDTKAQIPAIIQQEKLRFERLGGVYRLQPLVRVIQRLATELDFYSSLEEIADIVSQTSGGDLNRMLITASHTARFDFELVNEITRYYFASNFTQAHQDQISLLANGSEPISILPNAPGFQEGRIKLYINRYSMIVYLPNASSVDQLDPFFVRYISNEAGKHQVVQSWDDYRVSDHLILLGPNDGYASFAIPADSQINSVEIGQKSEVEAHNWSTSFSINRVRSRDNF